MDLISRQAAIAVADYTDCTGLAIEDVKKVTDEVVKELKKLPSAQPKQTRVFVELVVEYLDPELCAYKEFKGKPYYSIKYIENGETYVGYGTYKPEVLSQYLREYFMPSAQPNLKQTCNELATDVISRQDAIDAVEKSRRLNHHQDGKEACAHEYEHRHFLKILRDLPPAQPESPELEELDFVQPHKKIGVQLEITQPEQKTEKWIPCSERPPEKCGWYMCTLKDNRVNAYYWNNKGEWVDNGKKHFFELYNISGRYTGKEITAEQEGSVYWTDWVIAWMPLPEPYTERLEK